MPRRRTRSTTCCPSWFKVVVVLVAICASYYVNVIMPDQAANMKYPPGRAENKDANPKFPPPPRFQRGRQYVSTAILGPNTCRVEGKIFPCSIPEKAWLETEKRNIKAYEKLMQDADDLAAMRKKFGIKQKEGKHQRRRR